MVNIKVLCDDRFDPNLTYTIYGEKVTDFKSGCETCKEYEKCQGWAKEFGRCQEGN